MTDSAESQNPITNNTNRGLRLLGFHPNHPTDKKLLYNVSNTTRLLLDPLYCLFSSSLNMFGFASTIFSIRFSLLFTFFVATRM